MLAASTPFLDFQFCGRLFALDGSSQHLKSICFPPQCLHGRSVLVKMSGDIPCDLQDMQGNTVTKALISDVVLTKGTPFNLFTLTTLMRQGWILGGNDNSDKVMLVTFRQFPLFSKLSLQLNALRHMELSCEKKYCRIHYLSLSTPYMV
jgi:hypothetical protein